MSPDPTQPARPNRNDAIPVVPPPVHASVSHIATVGSSPFSTLSELFPAHDIPLWTPSIADLLLALGWRWVIMTPALVVVLGPVIALLLLPVTRAALFSIWFLKIWLFALGVVATLVIWAYRNVVALRTGIFCIHCGYDLHAGPPTGVCPECGRRYVPGICDEYRKDPAFFRRRIAALRSSKTSVGINVAARAASPAFTPSVQTQHGPAPQPLPAPPPPADA